jgi:hypothetical protein
MRKRWVIAAMRPLIAVIYFTLITGCARQVRDAIPSSHVVCELPRPELCAAIYQPVCGVGGSGNNITYSSGCRACSEPRVVSHTAGACDATPLGLD